MGGPQIELNHAALLLVLGEEMQVDLIGAKLGPPVPDFRQVERLRLVLDAPNLQNGAPAVVVTTNEQIDRFRSLRALDQAENGMYVPPARGTRPKLKLLNRGLLQQAVQR